MFVNIATVDMRFVPDPGSRAQVQVALLERAEVHFLHPRELLVRLAPEKLEKAFWKSVFSL